MSRTNHQPALSNVRRCDWCQNELPFNARPYMRFCDQTCRQWAHRTKKRVELQHEQTQPMRFRYDDPGYIGRARKYYKMPEVDHAELIRDALSQNYDGYALSCATDSLRVLLPLMPENTRVCFWGKPHPPSPNTYGIHCCTEVVLVVGGRQRRPGVRDWLKAMPARSGGTLPGRKPAQFAEWLYKLLGGAPGDTLYEKFPGTGIVGRVWKELQRAASLLQESDASSTTSGDANHWVHCSRCTEGRGAQASPGQRYHPWLGTPDELAAYCLLMQDLCAPVLETTMAPEAARPSRSATQCCFCRTNPVQDDTLFYEDEHASLLKGCRCPCHAASSGSPNDASLLDASRVPADDAPVPKPAKQRKAKGVLPALPLMGRRITPSPAWQTCCFVCGSTVDEEDLSTVGRICPDHRTPENLAFAAKELAKMKADGDCPACEGSPSRCQLQHGCKLAPESSAPTAGQLPLLETPRRRAGARR